MAKNKLFESAFSQVSEGESIEHIKNSDIFKNSFTPQKEKGSEVEKISLELIAPRFENKYIRDPKTLNALIASIKNNGLIQPIVLIPINKRLDKIDKKQNKDEYEYLKKQQELGKAYTVSSGHRRFEAYIKILLTSLNKPINNPNNIYSDFEAYYTEIKQEEQKFLNDNKSVIDENALKKEIYGVVGIPKDVDEKLKIYSYLYIPSIIEEKNDNETGIYNDTNITARPLTQFEIVINANDEVLNKYGDNFVDKYKKDSREGYNSALSHYIEEQYNIDIAANRIAKVLRINSLYSPEVIQTIFEGKLSARDAYELLSIYERVNKDELLREINNGKLDIKKLKGKYGNKRLKQKKEKYTSEEWRKFILKVKSGDMTLEELFEKAEE